MNNICFFARVDRSALNLINFYRLNLDILKDLGYTVKIATKWREIDWSCKILVVYWWTWAFFPVFVAKLLNKKTVIMGAFNFRCPDASKDYFRRSWFERFLIQYSVKNADINIFDSKNEMEQVKTYWNLNNCLYSPLSIQTDKFIPLEGLQRKNNIVFTVCGLQKTNMERKCIFEMIDAVEIILNKGLDIYYYIAGRNGDGLIYLSKYIEGKKLDKYVKVLGEIDESKKILLMQECTIFFQISKYEAFGLAIAEAMACGAPVITSQVGEVPNVVGDAAVICRGYSPQEISLHLELLLKDSYKRQMMSERARKQIVDNFQYSRRYNDLKTILEKLSK